jgi:hypothetical protein
MLRRLFSWRSDAGDIMDGRDRQFGRGCGQEEAHSQNRSNKTYAQGVTVCHGWRPIGSDSTLTLVQQHTVTGNRLSIIRVGRAVSNGFGHPQR